MRSKDIRSIRTERWQLLIQVPRAKWRHNRRRTACRRRHRRQPALTSSGCRVVTSHPLASSRTGCQVRSRRVVGCISRRANHASTITIPWRCLISCEASPCRHIGTRCLARNGAFRMQEITLDVTLAVARIQEGGLTTQSFGKPLIDNPNKFIDDLGTRQFLGCRMSTLLRRQKHD